MSHIVNENLDTLQKCIDDMFNNVHDILADEYEAPIVSPTPLEIQMAEQLREQARQMEEMKRMMASLLEAEKDRKAVEQRKAAEMQKAIEQCKAEVIAARKAEMARAKTRSDKSWSCPADEYVYPWTYDGKKYFRNSDNHVWCCAGNGKCGVWKGVYLIAEDMLVECREIDAHFQAKKLREVEEKRKQREAAEKLRKAEEERKQREAAEHPMRQEEAKKRSAARIQAGEFSIWNRRETQMGPTTELITGRGNHVWSSDRTPITVDGKVCVGPRLGEYMGINFGSIHFSLCGISRNCITREGVTYDGREEPKLY